MPCISLGIGPVDSVFGHSLRPLAPLVVSMERYLNIRNCEPRGPLVKPCCDVHTKTTEDKAVK